jgi:hypothetical protein
VPSRATLRARIECQGSSLIELLLGRVHSPSLCSPEYADVFREGGARICHMADAPSYPCRLRCPHTGNGIVLSHTNPSRVFSQAGATTSTPYQSVPGLHLAPALRPRIAQALWSRFAVGFFHGLCAWDYQLTLASLAYKYAIGDEGRVQTPGSRLSKITRAEQAIVQPAKNPTITGAMASGETLCS